MPKLPNLSSLRAFDAAARQGSFARASEELGVTPAAISHQIRKLEEELGVQLFLRSHKSSTLTVAGRRYAKRVAQGFAALSYREVNQPAGSERVVIEADSLLCRFWLLPHLSRCDIDLNLLELDVRTHSAPPQTLPVDTDIALTRGAHDRDGFKRFRLLSPRLVGITAPDHPVASLSSIERRPLVHYNNDEDWRFLCEASGTHYPKDQGNIYFNRPEHVIEATALGLGTGTAEDVLAVFELKAKRLAMIPGASLTGRSYYMATRKPRLSASAAKIADLIRAFAEDTAEWQKAHMSTFPATRPRP